MRPQDTVRLDTHALVARFEASGLKQWALAERLGVHRKTVSRWLTGRIQRVERVNAEALAQILACPLDALLVGDGAVYATAAEQARAASLVRERELVELLSPTADWELAERLVKATLRPELALDDLGRLYNLLSITAWRQQRYDEARGHAEQP
jgi:transcriptional regulator with XRE-family HTH domain